MLAENKKAKFDYEVVERFEAGIVLSGSEVKSIRTNTANLTGSRVTVREGVLTLVGMNVPKYKFDSNEEYVADRSRKLLMKKKEIVMLEQKMKSAGLTLVPLKLYNKGNLVKVELGLVRGKRKYEKRELIKKRVEERAIARRLKNN